LTCHDHTMEVIAKANCLLGLIRKSLEYLKQVTLFVTIVRPILEYSNLVSGPEFILDQRKLEKFHLPSLANEPYSYRLYSLQLPSLQYRRLKSDLILLHKIIKGYLSSNFNNFFYICTQTSSQGDINLKCSSHFQVSSTKIYKTIQ